MTREAVKKILDQQLELLAEQSKRTKNIQAIVDISLAIADIAKVRLDHFAL